MSLSGATIQQAIGRACLVYELEAVERRAAEAVRAVDDLDDRRRELAKGGNDEAKRTVAAALDERQAELGRLMGRAQQINGLLWGPERAETLEERLSSLDGRGLDDQAERLLQVHPEITIVANFEGLTVHEKREYLAEKIRKLPEEEQAQWPMQG